MTSPRARLAALALGLAAALVLTLAVAPLLRREEPERLEFFAPDAGVVAEALAKGERMPSRTGLVRLRLDEAQAAKVFPLDQPHARFDPHTWYGYLPDLDLTRPWPDGSGRWPLRTNSLGMREDAEPSQAPPDLRVLVAGDSHTDGVCPNAMSFPNLAEACLAEQFEGRAVEVLNAARGGYTFYQYLGTLERFLDLDPDVFVVAAYGGNDFGEALNLRNFFVQNTKRAGAKPYRERVDRALAVEPELFGQAVLSTAYFAQFPRRRVRAAEACADVLREILAVCEERGIVPVLLYLPSVLAARPQSIETLDELLAALEIDRAALAGEDEMADLLLAAARALDVRVVDLRADFAAAEEPLYWPGEWHLNPAGHRLVATRLTPVLADQLAPR